MANPYLVPSLRWRLVQMVVSSSRGKQMMRASSHLGALLLSAAARFELRRLDTILRKSNAPPMANLCECNSKHTPPFPNSDCSRKQWRRLIMAKASAKALAERPGLGGDSDSAQDRTVVLQLGEKRKGVRRTGRASVRRTRARTDRRKSQETSQSLWV